jgi:tRNA-specific 2-thiouridylase
VTLNNNKVYVGLSGGVDSAVSAALLKKAGYDVTGVFIEVWQPDWIECNWKEDRRDAMRVAAHLHIPFINLDLIDEYKQGVIDYLLYEYKAGRTPNPDVMCNREVKFGAFWKWAKENGADFIATGHYAQNTKKELLKGKDPNKDQSYFLWTLNQNDLDHVLFPVGHLLKSVVRRIASELGLPNFDKKDSQGLCFIGKIDLKEFLAHYIQSEPGNVLNEKGEIIGIHPGALFFTIGERHGFTINKKSPDDLPYYVIAKDIESNSITVSNRSAEVGPASNGQTITLNNINWINNLPVQDKIYQARSRYRQELQNVTILINNDNAKAEVNFTKVQETLTPGQSLVIYDGEICLGGGVIQ